MAITTGVNKYWLISKRPFQETSIIVELITDTDQRVSAIIKGAKKSKFCSYLNPFICLHGKLLGKSNLKKFTSIEPIRQYNLQGIKLFCGFYLNELILRSTINGQVLEGITAIYTDTLKKLEFSNKLTIQPILRAFELKLLDISGYLPNLTRQAINNISLQDNQSYVLVNEIGIVAEKDLKQQYEPQSISHPFKGYIWKQLALKTLYDQDNFIAYKTITRFLLRFLIGDKPLNSHKFFYTNKT
jgi:DNA repair protein RecO (recombination protein O)